MLRVLIYAMVYLGSALMVYNIYNYTMFARQIRKKGDWQKEEQTLNLPIILLVLFLLGYLAVGIFGHPDLVISGILFGGSIFVFIIFTLIQRIVSRIQENEHLEAELIATEESNRVKSAFLSSMSHEIRTPMNAIIGLDNLALADPSLSPRTRSQLEKIGASAHHLLVLINDILDVNRIESGHLELTDAPFSSAEFLQQIRAIIKGLCDDKGLRYDFQASGGLEPYYCGDSIKLKQILLNILGNSIKFTPPGGTVCFTVAQTAGYGEFRTLRFVISDTGIGISQEYLPKIYDAFSQEDSSTTNRYGGSGLGLTITKKLLDFMNGDIRVESEKGKGSTFTVTVTLKAAEEDQLPVEMTTEMPAEIPVDMPVKLSAETPVELSAEGSAGMPAELSAEGPAGMPEELSAELSDEVAGGIAYGEPSPPELDLQVCAEAVPDTPATVAEARGSAASGDAALETMGNAAPSPAALGTRNGAEINPPVLATRADTEAGSVVLGTRAVAENDAIASGNRASAEAGSVVLGTRAVTEDDPVMLGTRADAHNTMPPSGIDAESISAVLAGKHILVVEDIDINAEILIDLLDLEEISADRAENGQVAVKLFSDSAPGDYDAVLMDLRMPVMDGLSATRAIRALDRPDAATVPILALTANAFAEDVQRSLQAGMDAHLSKPVEPDYLYEALAKLIAEKDAGNRFGEVEL